MVLKKGVGVGVLVVLGFLIILNSQAQEGILWVDKFSTKKVTGGLPEGWRLEKKTGEPQIKIEQTGENAYLHLISNNSSFGLTKELKFEIKDYPFLNWKWKVTRLPEKGDFLKKETDDQAAQMYVPFPRFPTKVNTEIVGYTGKVIRRTKDCREKARPGQSPRSLSWKPAPRN